jgi:hypothetical protein
VGSSTTASHRTTITGHEPVRHDHGSHDDETRRGSRPERSMGDSQRPSHSGLRPGLLP